MFTGLITDVGTVCSSEKKGSNNYRRLIIASKSLSKKIRKGDSIAVNGVCLTVAAYSRFSGTIEFEILQSSLEKTNLSVLQLHDVVNLEPSLRLGDTLGGHFVLGHVESTGSIVSISYDTLEAQSHVPRKKEKTSPQEATQNINYFYTLKVPSSMMMYMCPEASIALDGISLTISSIDTQKHTITVNIIPHTYYHTNLQYRKENDTINVEPDMLLKHVTRIARRSF